MLLSRKSYRINMDFLGSLPQLTALEVPIMSDITGW